MFVIEHLKQSVRKQFSQTSYLNSQTFAHTVVDEYLTRANFNPHQTKILRDKGRSVNNYTQYRLQEQNLHRQTTCSIKLGPVCKSFFPSLPDKLNVSIMLSFDDLKLHLIFDEGNDYCKTLARTCGSVTCRY